MTFDLSGSPDYVAGSNACEARNATRPTWCNRCIIVNTSQTEIADAPLGKPRPLEERGRGPEVVWMPSVSRATDKPERGSPDRDRGTLGGHRRV